MHRNFSNGQIYVHLTAKHFQVEIEKRAETHVCHSMKRQCQAGLKRRRTIKFMLHKVARGATGIGAVGRKIYRLSVP